MLAIFQITLLIIVGLLIAYLAFLSVVAWFEQQPACTQTESKRRFAIVIPAYNEEAGIARTLRNLQRVRYPSSGFDIIVVADNCTDGTAMVARKEGVFVMERANPYLRGKGYALRWCFNRFLEQKEKYPYDAVVVVDADSIVSDNLLQVMNKYLEKGAEVVQGYLTVDSKPGAWTSEIIRIGFTLYNYVRPLARRHMGLPAGLRGNGMCFSMEVLERVPWCAYSLTEDLEYGIQLLLHDVNVVFAPEAIGMNVVPSDAKNAESQRERWERGRIPILKKYFPMLLFTGIRRRSFRILDTLIDLVTPPLVNLMLVTGAMMALSCILWLAGIQSFLYTGLWILIFCLGLFHALLGLFVAGAERSLYWSLLYVPRYAIWKIYIYVRILLFKGRTTEWVRTSRELL